MFSAFHVTLIVLNCALMCYTERDSLEVMLTKTGTITQTAAKARAEQEVDPLSETPASKPRRGSAREESAREPNPAVAGALVRQDAKGGQKKKKRDDGQVVPRGRGAEVELV